MADAVIRVERPQPAVALITLDRPDARNALSNQLLAAAADALSAMAEDDGVRCAVVTGGPKVFAAGADLKETAGLDAVGAMRNPRAGHWDTIRRFPKPLIAAVNGYALGGGNELAMLADIVIAGETATFGQPEINLGLIPGAGGTQRLPRAVGKSVAMKIILAAEFIDAPTALAAGLIAEVTAPAATIGRALELAATIAAKPPLAVRLAKEAVLAAYEAPLEAGLAAERKAYVTLFGTADMREGVSAFLEKRTPKFEGR